MNRTFLTLSKIALFLALLPFIARFCLKHTDRFSIAGIISDRPFDPAWEARPLKEEERIEILKALDQPYTYFGSGGQSFIFTSADQRYVLKFFKQHFFNVPLWVAYFPIPWVLNRYSAKKTEQRGDKLKRDFNSYKMAFEELAEETGVLFVHLNKTNDLKKTVAITDKLGIEHILNLDAMEFVMQRKGVLAYDKISAHLAKGEVKEAKEAVRQILHLIVNRCKKGFHDRDANICTNCGFIEGKAVEIDVGHLVRDERMKIPEIYWQELLRISEPFRGWIGAEHPLLLPCLDEELLKLQASHETP